MESYKFHVPLSISKLCRNFPDLLFTQCSHSHPKGSNQVHQTRKHGLTSQENLQSQPPKQHLEMFMKTNSTLSSILDFYPEIFLPKARNRQTKQ